MSNAETSADAVAAGAGATVSPPRSLSPSASSSAAPAPPATSAPPSSSSAPNASSSTTSAAMSSAPSAAASEQNPPSSNMHPPGTFSSSPVAPVVASNHHRRWRSELGWIKPDSDLRRRDDSAASPGDGSRARARGRSTAAQRSRSPSHDSSKSDTSDEDIRAPRGASEPAATAGNSTGRQHGSPSLPSTSDNRTHGTGELSSQRDQVTSQDGRESNQQQARRSRSRSPEDEPSERRGYQDSAKASSYVDGSRTPSPVERDVRILFKGREIFADDLIGLRVAKTFAGHGRFLGQVVKFDGPTSLYTVVYADGDAEDLSVENTIQILIQDEIERVDPSLPPPSNSLFFKREGTSLAGVDSPNGTESSEMMATGAPYRHQRSQSGGSSEYRSVIRISDREAQFVVGLFENHALPILLQQGWRVQSNPSGGEARYVAPGVGDGFSSSGAIFRSALDVVEYIASDNELLTACFPTNVHSAILSLLPDSNRRQSAESSPALSSSGVRKRDTADVPGIDAFANKRHRQPRDDMYGGSGDARRMVPTAASPRVETAMGGHAYRSAELEYRMREREATIRQGMPAERFASAEPAPTRAGAPIPNTRQSYYSSAEYRGGHSRHPSDGSASSSRWSGEPPVAPVSDKPMYHRRYEESPRWREREAPARGGYYTLEPSNAEAIPRSYPRAERYYGGYGGERTLTRPGFRGTRDEVPPDYRYQGQEEAPLGVPTDAYRHRYADTPPHRGGFADGRQIDGALDLSVGRLPRDAAILSAADSRMRRDSPAISMMDVDRLTSSRGVGRGDQSASRSPRGGVDASAAYATFRGQYVSQRGGGSLYAVETSGSADMDVSSDAPVPQDEERAV